ncbi:hypothetical protein ACIBBB_24395 [Streptomyces sp. NPDC051217]|uniref:hypothetical protein n=1 Tax=Streptomyces sp. NPDC051217 TaxID=3365644 RepID=UPI00378976B6
MIAVQDNAGEVVCWAAFGRRAGGGDVPEIWAGVDIGKEHHHCVVIDAQGERLLSRRS